jgi:thymidylate kinase
MQILGRKNRTTLISFSGMDGAGKSTQIDALCARLRGDGLRVLVLRFWDDIAWLTRFREAAGHSIFHGDKGIGSPSAPISRRDKNVRSGYMTCVRLFLYSVDAISVRLAVARARHSLSDVVIFDRYMHDELANLPLNNRPIRAYVMLIMRLVPRPDASFLLDADPVKARARKPEYPIEFLHANRQAYFTLNALVGGFTVVAPLPIMEVAQIVLGKTLQLLALRTPQGTSPSSQTSSDPESKATQPSGQ